MRQSYLAFWQRIGDFKGVTGRMDFWVPVIINYLLGGLAIIGIAEWRGISLGTLLTTGGSELHLLGRVVLAIVWLTLLSVKVRRLHAVGLSGWWILANCLPGIGGLLMTIVVLLPNKAQQRPAA